MRAFAAFWVALVLLALPAGESSGQVTLQGVVVLDTERGPGVGDVDVFADGAQKRVTRTNGAFELVFPSGRVGSQVTLRLSHPAYEVVNAAQLLQTLPAGRNAQPIVLVIRKIGAPDARYVALVRVATDAIMEHYEREMRLKRDSIASLRRERDDALSRVPRVVAELIKVNLDSASDVYRRAFAAFSGGRIADAQAILDAARVEEQMEAAYSAVAALEELLRQTRDAALLKARISAFNRRYAEAAATYAAVLRTDSTAFSPLMEMGDVRLAQGRAVDAIALYSRAVNHASNPVDSARGLLVLGRLKAGLRDGESGRSHVESAVRVLGRLARADSARYRVSLADGYGTLALLSLGTPGMGDAIDSARALYTRLAEHEPHFLADLASIYNLETALQLQTAQTAPTSSSIVANILGSVFDEEPITKYDTALTYLEGLSPAQARQAIASRLTSVGAGLSFQATGAASAPATADVAIDALIGVTRVGRGTAIALLLRRREMLRDNRVSSNQHVTLTMRDAEADFSAGIRRITSIQGRDSLVANVLLANVFMQIAGLRLVNEDVPRALQSAALAKSHAERLDRFDSTLFRPTLGMAALLHGAVAKEAKAYPTAIGAYKQAVAAFRPATVQDAKAFAIFGFSAQQGLLDSYVGFSLTNPDSLPVLRPLALTAIKEARAAAGSLPHVAALQLSQAVAEYEEFFTTATPARMREMAANRQIEDLLDRANDLTDPKIALPTSDSLRVADSLYRKALQLRRDPEILRAYARSLLRHAQISKSTAAQLDYAKRAVVLVQEAVDSVPDDDDLLSELAQALNNLSWYNSLAGQFDETVSIARRGLAADSSITILRENLAIGLLFTNRYQEALAEITRVRNLKAGNRTLEEVFLEDLETLAQAGRSHRDVSRIREALRASSIKP